MLGTRTNWLDWLVVDNLYLMIWQVEVAFHDAIIDKNESRVAQIHTYTQYFYYIACIKKANLIPARLWNVLITMKSTRYGLTGKPASIPFANLFTEL